MAKKPEKKSDGKVYAQDEHGNWLEFNPHTRAYGPVRVEGQPPEIPNKSPYLAGDGHTYKREEGVDFMLAPGSDDVWVELQREVLNPRHSQELGDGYKRAVGQIVDPDLDPEKVDIKTTMQNARDSKVSRRKVGAIVVAGIVAAGVASEVVGSHLNRNDCNFTDFQPDDVASVVIAANGVPNLDDPIAVSSANGAAIRVIDSRAADSCSNFEKQEAAKAAVSSIRIMAGDTGNTTDVTTTTEDLSYDTTGEPSVSDSIDSTTIPDEDKNVYCDENGIVTRLGKDLRFTDETTGLPAKGPCVIDFGR